MNKLVRIVVDWRGGGDFRTVQEAVMAAPEHSDERTVIEIRKGVYEEKIIVPDSRKAISFIGESREGTVLVSSNYANMLGPDGKKLGNENSASTFVYAEDFYAERLTFSNQAGLYKGQAVALAVSGDRAVFRDVCIRGNQDTLYTPGQGRQYYENCFIEGTVDFIFGSATAVFEGCELHSIRRHNGYVTAASTTEEQLYGYVFLNCRLTGAAPEHSVSLGRPWKPYAKVVFIDSWMDNHIRPEGWDNWRDPERERTATFAEYGSKGPGARLAERAPWAKRLGKPEAGGIKAAALRGSDGWDPAMTVTANV